MTALYSSNISLLILSYGILLMIKLYWCKHCFSAEYNMVGLSVTIAISSMYKNVHKVAQCTEIQNKIQKLMVDISLNHNDKIAKLISIWIFNYLNNRTQLLLTQLTEFRFMIWQISLNIINAYLTKLPYHNISHVHIFVLIPCVVLVTRNHYDVTKALSYMCTTNLCILFSKQNSAPSASELCLQNPAS